ncbi:MAG: hypothetical protein HY255_05190 [Betaproteobacteria bacterium]|nr:hypothetical protein [Betaproteobacteria bacterium]
MSDYSKPFYRNLLTGVKQAIRQSPELKRELKRSRAPRLLAARELLSNSLLSVLWQAAAIFGFAVGSDHYTTGLLGLSVWMAGVATMQSNRLRQTLLADGDLPLLLLAPVSNAEIFRRQFEKFLRGSGKLFATILVSHWLILVVAGFPMLPVLLAPLTAAFTWAVVLLLAMLCATYIPERIMSRVRTICFFGFFAIIAFNQKLVPPLYALAAQYGAYIECVLPTAWPNALQRWALHQGQWTDLLMVAATALLLVNYRRIYENFRARTLPGAYEIHDGSMIRDKDSEDEPDHTIDAGAGIAALAAEFDRSSESNAAATPRAGQSLAGSAEYTGRGHSLDMGWMETHFWRWLTPTEQNLSEFVFPNGWDLRGGWRTAAKFLAGTYVLASLTAVASAHAAMWILVLGTMLAMFTMLSMVLARGSAFQPYAVYGVNIPFYAFYPVSYRELSRLLFKFALVQMPYIALMSFCAVGVLAWAADKPWWVALHMSLNAIVLIVALRYVSTITAVSANTNDTSRFNLRSLSLLGLVFIQFLAFIGLTIGALLISWDEAASGNLQIRACVLLLLAVADVWLFDLIYRWYHDSNRFDLMAMQKGPAGG